MKNIKCKQNLAINLETIKLEISSLILLIFCRKNIRQNKKEFFSHSRQNTLHISSRW